MWFNRCSRAGRRRTQNPTTDSQPSARRRPPSACDLRTACPSTAAGELFSRLRNLPRASPTPTQHHSKNIVRSFAVNGLAKKLASQNKPKRLTHNLKRVTHRRGKNKSNICCNESGSARRFLRVMLREIGVHHGDTDVPCSLLHYHYVRFGRYRPNPTQEKVRQEDDVRKLEQPGGHLAAKQSDKHHP